MKPASLLLISTLFLWSTATLALGLGQAELHSRLGDKLQAEMPVIGMENWTTNDLKITLASPEIHEKMQIDYQASNLDLRFNIKPGSTNEPTLFITSSSVIKEPYLHFVIEMNYPQGTVLKDVSLLLDAPR